MITFRLDIPPLLLPFGGLPVARSRRAHLLSISCTVAAVLLAWTWFRTIYPRRLARFGISPGS